MPRVLLTSVCRPIGPSQGDAPSVGYELLHGQVTRAQGAFSPRSHHLHFSLEYNAENLDAPCVVLQYPSRRELIASVYGTEPIIAAHPVSGVPQIMLQPGWGGAVRAGVGAGASAAVGAGKQV